MSMRAKRLVNWCQAQKLVNVVPVGVAIPN